MKKWEYLIKVEPAASGNTDAITRTAELLNQLGAEGWELTSVAGFGNQNTHAWLYFKRLAQSNLDKTLDNMEKWRETIERSNGSTLPL